MSGPSSASERSRRMKRKDSPERMTLRKRNKPSEGEHAHTSVEEVSVRGGKRKVREDEEDQPQRLKSRRVDTKTASSSIDTRRVSGSTSVEEKRDWKRKADGVNEEEPRRKQRRKLDPEETKQDTKQKTKQDALRKALKGHDTSSMAGPSSASETKSRTRRMKRKASPERVPLRKLSEGEHANSSEEEVRVRGGESQAANGKGPGRNKRRMKPKKTKEETKRDTKQETSRASSTNLREEFEAKYQQQHELGKGGCGSVFAGYRKADHLPVAIKHIPKETVFCREADKNGKLVASEVAIMLKLAEGSSESVGSSVPVSLLDWYDLGRHLILVMERPTPSMDMFSYIQSNGGCLEEHEAKVIMKQLVDAATGLLNNKVFHRDIKIENILIETGTDEPRVRLIDFGMGCFTKTRSIYRRFCGTSPHTPPEFYRRFFYRAGPTTVWQLGVVLFESLHMEEFETIKFLGNPNAISADLSADCQDFLDKCLRPKPQQRSTVEQLRSHAWLR